MGTYISHNNKNSKKAFDFSVFFNENCITL